MVILRYVSHSQRVSSPLAAAWPRLSLDLHGTHLLRHRAKHLQRRQLRGAAQQEALAQHQGAAGEVGIGDQQLLGIWMDLVMGYILIIYSNLDGSGWIPN